MKLDPWQHNTQRSTPRKRARGVYALQKENRIRRPCLFTYKPLCSSLDSHHFLIQLQNQHCRRVFKKHSDVEFPSIPLMEGECWLHVCGGNISAFSWGLFFNFILDISVFTTCFAKKVLLSEKFRFFFLTNNNNTMRFFVWIEKGLVSQSTVTDKVTHGNIVVIIH